MVDNNAGPIRRGSSRNRAGAANNDATTGGTTSGRITRSMSRASSVADSDAGSDAGGPQLNSRRQPQPSLRGRTNVGNELGTILEANNLDSSSAFDQPADYGDQDNLVNNSAPNDTPGLNPVGKTPTTDYKPFVLRSAIAALLTLYNVRHVAELLSCSWIAAYNKNKLGHLVQWFWHHHFLYVIQTVVQTAPEAYAASAREARLEQSEDSKRAAKTEYEEKLRICLEVMLSFITHRFLILALETWFRNFWSYPAAAATAVCIQRLAASTDDALRRYTGCKFHSLKWIVLTRYTFLFLWAGVLWLSSTPDPSWHIAKSHAEYGGPMGGSISKTTKLERCSVPAEFITLTSTARIGSRTADVTYAVFDCNYRPNYNVASRGKNGSQSPLSLSDSVRLPGVGYQTITTPSDASSSASVSASLHTSEEDVPSSLTKAR